MIIRASHSVEREPASCYRPLINCYAIWRHTRLSDQPGLESRGGASHGGERRPRGPPTHISLGTERIAASLLL